MKKISQPFKKQNRSGYYLRWYEQVKGKQKQKHKHFNTKSEAEHYRHLQYMKLNSDVYTNIVLPYDDAVREYIASYDIKGYKKTSVYQTKLVLNRFKDLCRPKTTKEINQKAIDFYIVERKKDTISNWTVNKDIGRLTAFLNWLKERGYHQGNIKLHKQPVSKNPKSALTDAQIKLLLTACPSQEWKLRIILCLCCGIRRNDLYGLPVGDIDFDNNWIGTREQKTRKYYSGALPDALMPALKEYHDAAGERKYFFRTHSTGWLNKQFRSFRPDKSITIQGLRRTFSTRIETTSISTAMLNHSSNATTRQFYNDMDYIKYIRVNQLPVKEWLGA